MVNIIVLITLPILVGLFEGLMDKIMFHYEKSIFCGFKNQQFYNPYISWRNKYKDDLKTPKFYGSTTFLVFLTDAWHLFKWLKNRFLHFFILYLFYILFFNLIEYYKYTLIILK